MKKLFLAGALLGASAAWAGVINPPVSPAAIGAEQTANKGAASGYAGLSASALLPAVEFPQLTGDCGNSAGSLVVACANR